LLASLPAAGGAQAITAEQALNNYRQVIKPTRELDCPKGADDEIVVCGGEAPTETERYRAPLPIAPTPGARNRDVITSGMGAMRSDACQAYERCGSGGFSISVNLLTLPGKIAKAIDRITND
jgi:hypothetical protein